MKKTLFVIVVVLIATISVQAQGLRADAIKIRNDIPEQYAIIKNYAEKVWKGDNMMIIDEINAECEAFFLLASLMKKHSGSSYAGKILIIGFIESSHDGWEKHNLKMIDEEKLNSLHIIWQDVFIYVDYNLKHR